MRTIEGDHQSSLTPFIHSPLPKVYHLLRLPSQNLYLRRVILWLCLVQPTSLSESFADERDGGCKVRLYYIPGYLIGPTLIRGLQLIACFSEVL
jgi:hypothetical protein